MVQNIYSMQGFEISKSYDIIKKRILTKIIFSTGQWREDWEVNVQKQVEPPEDQMISYSANNEYQIQFGSYSDESS